MKPPIEAIEVPDRKEKSLYPEPFKTRTAGKEKKKLGDFFGLTNFGVNHVRIEPGAQTALLHAHSTQDEFFYILSGAVELVTEGDQRYPMTAGMCVGFPKRGAAHYFHNPTDEEAVILEIGDRSRGDQVTYPEDDLKAVMGANGDWIFTRKNGELY